MLELENFISKAMLFDAAKLLTTRSIFKNDYREPILSAQFSQHIVGEKTRDESDITDKVFAELDWSAGPIIASSNTHCTYCKSEAMPCVHIAAIAIDHLAKLKPIAPYPSEKKRADTAVRLLKTDLSQRFDPYPNMARHRVVYLLSIRGEVLHLEVYKGYVSKTGDYSIKADFGFEILARSSLPKFICQTDHWLLEKLKELASRLSADEQEKLVNKVSLSVEAICDDEFISHLMATEHCFWQSCDGSKPLKIEHHSFNDFIDHDYFYEITKDCYLDLASNSVVRLDSSSIANCSDESLGQYIVDLNDKEREWQPKLSVSRHHLEFSWDEQLQLELDVSEFSLNSNGEDYPLDLLFSVANEAPHLIKIAAEFNTQLVSIPLLSTQFESVVWQQFTLGTRLLTGSLSEQLIMLRRLMLAGWLIELKLKNRFDLVKPQRWYTYVGQALTEKRWFDLELGVEFDGRKINLLPYLVKAIRKGLLQNVSDNETVLMELDSGQRLSLPAQRIKQILAVLVELYEAKPLSNEETLTLPIHQLTRIAELASLEKINKKEWLWQGSSWLQNKASKMFSYLENEAEGVVKHPVGLNAQLREYQLSGVSWLQFLKQHEFSGLLADDMGLGKTIQTLSSILLDKESGEVTLPSLVIAPTSLLANWQHETQSFAPSLKLLLWSGPKRHKLQSQISESDLILTSYGTLQQDAKFWAEQHFHLIILDEAQMIKNVRSRINRVVCGLSARHRLCLTGTPMENHLGELWSLFNFLMPGFLGTYSQFQRLYQIPIEKEQDDERRQALVQRISPFMLRRVKAQVAKELPEKTVINEYISLTQAQGDLYETIRLTMSEEVRKAVSVSGIKRNRLAISNALLKLRQVCCHPQLLKFSAGQENVSLEHSERATSGTGHSEHLSQETSSGKLNWLADKLPNMVEEGRRILIFSSFTSMLDLIAELLENLTIDFVELTGKSRDRGQLVDRFQQHEVPIFLISLKAGGAGLNLTAADVVIHTDPWWNPAAEQQASDRAHRIGQDKSVFVYKLICKDTVEERIQLLQQTKQNLAQSIYQQDAKPVSEMSGEDWLSLLKPVGLE